MRKYSYQKGFYLPVILMASGVFIILVTALVSLAISNIKSAELHNKKITSMAIAEAGINYYLWHLSHNNTDYCDGNTCQGNSPYGPYRHNYTDQAGNIIGTYDLIITPPSTGRPSVLVESIGRVNGKSPERTVISELGIPSYTKFTLLTNNQQLWVGAGEKVIGNIHVNNSGLYNEGEITGDASSTEAKYNSWFGEQDGVSGPGIFGGSKLFPVTPVNMNQVTVDISNLQSKAKADGQHFNPSGANGYHIILKDANFDVYKVSKFDNQSLKIKEESVLGNYDYPTSGIIFLQDNIWIEGKINDQKITVVAADPTAPNESKMKHIYIPNKITYTNYDGRDKIGLITQTDILVTKDAPSIMEIDAAMIARNGEIRIDYYNEIKDRIKVYGSMAHNGGILWTYGNTDGTVTSGYRNTETIIDTSNVLNPPPDFPTTGTYTVLSWREE